MQIFLFEGISNGCSRKQRPLPSLNNVNIGGAMCFGGAAAGLVVR